MPWTATAATLAKAETVARAAASGFPPGKSLITPNRMAARNASIPGAIQQQGSALITLDAYDTLFLKNVFAASASDFIVHA